MRFCRKIRWNIYVCTLYLKIAWKSNCPKWLISSHTQSPGPRGNGAPTGALENSKVPLNTQLLIYRIAGAPRAKCELEPLGEPARDTSLVLWETELYFPWTASTSAGRWDAYNTLIGQEPFLPVSRRWRSMTPCREYKRPAGPAWASFLRAEQASVHTFLL